MLGMAGADEIDTTDTRHPASNASTRAAEASGHPENSGPSVQASVTNEVTRDISQGKTVSNSPNLDTGKGATEPSASPSNTNLNASGENAGSLGTQDAASKPKKAPRRKDHRRKGEPSQSDPNTPAPTVPNAQVSLGNADLASEGDEQTGRSKRGRKPTKRLLGEI
ncbi:hypothetical protein FS749_007103 [Ceratobasidium sp. UAMH 11750]|nr:hypothetical protein FS749_007103 [Ceratobasidium sp. UAMH 11750]